MSHLADIGTIALAVIALLGVIVGVIAWFYRRGGQERSFTDALTDNTKANRELSGELRNFKAETLTTLRDHDWRLRILEDGKQHK